MEPIVVHHSQQNPVFSSICRSLAMFMRSLIKMFRSPGPFQNLGNGALWYPCNGNNLQLSAPFRGQPYYHLKYCRCNMMCHVAVSCSPNLNSFKVAIQKLDKEKISKCTFVSKWGHFPLKRGGKCFVGNKEHIDQRLSSKSFHSIAR